jgi:glycosyltransferase involved in cell wall biosynthesis
MPKLVGIDASRYTAEQRTGTENYSFHLINAIARMDEPDLNFRYYLNARDNLPCNGLEGSETRPIPFPRLWTHVRLSAEMTTRRPDLLFVPSHVIPLIHPRSVVTIHDLGYLHEPTTHLARQRLILDRTTRWNARVASRIIAISKATRDDLVDHYGVDARKITVIPHGVSDGFNPVTSGAIASIRDRLGLPDSFVLTVGTTQPRKNLGNLASAVRILRNQGRPVSLVSAGKRGWLSDQVEREIRASLPEAAWRHLGYVSDSDLPALYGAASAVAMVSRYEGFGMPVVEAMACGAPTVISDRGSLPEVAGEYALIADPDDPASIAAQIARLLDDGPLRTRLIAGATVHAASFTWERAARETVAVFHDALRSH